MLADYFGLALCFAFPAVVAAAVLYYAAERLLAARADRQRKLRQVAEASHRRKVYADRYASAAEPGAPPSQPARDAAQGEAAPLLRPQAPRPTTRPFGSNTMTMSDMRSRITGPSGSCMPGSCCG
ncbi:hypothetical protein IWQ56_001129 [Coemansia nantahalensis]|uniref:Uncharacterized protein n=1 Tax=Coemansia nantahalensis TaxID=2789366 RepID=A0ACC1JUR1_9FUNG|nr:hypothetical protein IWQ57_003840 [Coemansia nantahalensis]KAJ2773063.1 hypothetical protein IWQ56_001129 [Coemansia nantahalensis]